MQQDKRAALTSQQAMEIFRLRIPACEMAGPLTNHSFTSRSVEISGMYGVSPKAVRDIWNRRTWSLVTSSMSTETNTLQHEEGFNSVLPMKKVGRPRGSKDSKPRQRRLLPSHLSRVDPRAECHSKGPTTRQSTMYFASPGDESVNQSGCDSFESPRTVAMCSNLIIAKTNEFVFSGQELDAYDTEERSLRRTYPFFLQI
jgi:hypothetical protein